MLKLGPDVLFQSFQALKNTGMLPLIVSALEKSGLDVSMIPGLSEVQGQNGHPYGGLAKDEGLTQVPATLAGATQKPATEK